MPTHVLRYPRFTSFRTRAAGRGWPARTRIKLGNGARSFAAAKRALERWEQFRLGWVEAWPPDTSIQAGQVVAVIARLFGLWWLNACRIVYTVDEDGPVKRYGFAYGTLPEHAEQFPEQGSLSWLTGLS